MAKMRERIHQLEDALAILQAKSSNEPHALLTDVNLKNRNMGMDEDDDIDISEQGPSSDVVSAFGMLSMSDQGISRFFGPTGGTEACPFACATCSVSLTLFGRSISSSYVLPLTLFYWYPDQTISSPTPTHRHPQATGAGHRSQYATRRRRRCPAK